MRRTSSPIAALAAVAYAVILGDLLTKLFAVGLVDDRTYSVLGAVRLGLVFNDEAGAFGLPARAFGIELSTLVVFGLILLMLRVCRELAAVDRRAPLMLGLLAGAGAANHMDMLASPRGVADFIALQGVGLDHIVFNVADMALLAGLILCARTAVILVVRILEERAPALAVAGGPGGSLHGGSMPGESISGELTPRQTTGGDRVRGLPTFREPGIVHAFLAASDAPRVGKAAGTGAGSSAERPAQPMSDDGGWMDMPSRFDRAATPALVIACSFILLYSLAIVWLPDAGRSAPSALLLALAVFGTVFVAVYAELAVAERRAARERARDATRLERERPLARVSAADSRRESPRPTTLPAADLPAEGPSERREPPGV